MIREVAVDVLLGLAVAVAVISSVGVLAMRDAYQKLHYLTPLSILAPVLVALAVLVQAGYSTRSSQTWLAAGILVIASPFLSHATIRAARIRAEGDWRMTAARDGAPNQDKTC
jgi:multisubunit Na+/H+ antiporter MnhG subunit